MRDETLKVLMPWPPAATAAGDSRVRDRPPGYFPARRPTRTFVAFQQEQIALDFLGPIKEVTGW